MSASDLAAGGNNNNDDDNDDGYLVPGIPLPARGGADAATRLFLLHGPSGAGKTMYCRQFLADGLARGNDCLYIDTCARAAGTMKTGIFFSGAPASAAREGSFRVLGLSDLYNDDDNNNDLLLNHHHRHHHYQHGSAVKESEKILASLQQRLFASAAGAAAETHAGKRPLRLVVDSLTPLLVMLGKRGLMHFTSGLSDLLKGGAAASGGSVTTTTTTTAILTIASMNRDLVSVLGSLVDGTLEMRFQERKGNGDGGQGSSAPARSIRLSSLKGSYHQPSWVNFEIGEDGSLVFSPIQDSGAAAAAVAGLTCTLCGRPVGRAPVVESDFVFDTKKCADTYRKFSDAYGSSMPETGLPSKVVDIGFFFVDIVGLSDPRLSVKSQVQKIEVLNRLIAECDAFKKTPAGQKLVLPAGDGMAIGFLLNPELPLELAIQLHRKLGQYNRERKWAGDRVQVRIGLGSGPIFTVSDLTNAQNVWGPGIILARRVMDAGDEGHILLAGNIAEDLIALKDEYRSIIRMVSDSFEIKHGQKIRLYSAYSPADFGNPQPPARAKAS